MDQCKVRTPRTSFLELKITKGTRRVKRLRTHFQKIISTTRELKPNKNCNQFFSSFHIKFPPFTVAIKSFELLTKQLVFKQQFRRIGKGENACKLTVKQSHNSYYANSAFDIDSIMSLHTFPIFQEPLMSCSKWFQFSNMQTKKQNSRLNDKIYLKDR